MYGLKGRARETFKHYVETGRHAVLIDLGYWNRKPASSPLSGHHRVSVDHWHPNAYFQTIKHPPDRWKALGVRISDHIHMDGGPIILAGMSAKAAWVYGLDCLEWEHRAVHNINRHSGRMILYRPKPSARETYQRLWPGVEYVNPAIPIHHCFKDIWALVTHHGNTAIDAIEAGVPVFCDDGIAAVLSRTMWPDSADHSWLEDPYRYGFEERDQFFADAAYCQWTPAEMRSGEMWQHLLNERLLG